MILTALSGEHLLLLGPPGTAKSELSRRLSKQTGGKYFERLLTRFSVPEVWICSVETKQEATEQRWVSSAGLVTRLEKSDRWKMTFQENR